MQRIKTYIVILLLTITKISLSGCPPGVNVYPNGEKISSNQVFLFESWIVNNIVDSLELKYHPTLVSNFDTVELVVIEHLKFECLVTQALLRPKNPLKEGVKYALQIDSLKIHESHVFEKIWDKSNDYPKKVEWIVDSTYNSLPNKWKKEPHLLQIDTNSIGSINSRFNFKLELNQEEIIRIDILDTSMTSHLSYYRIINPQYPIGIGYNICPTPYKCEKMDDFSVRFSFFDLDKMKTYESTSWIDITHPRNKE